MARFGVAILALLAAIGCTEGAKREDAAFVVGSSSSGVPFTFLDVASNAPRGVMVDVVRAIGEDAGFPVEVRILPFNALIPSLTSGRIRLIAAAMVMTPPRREVIAFSDPVYRYGEALIVSSRDATEYRSFEDLKGKVVGAQVGTVYFDGLRDSGLFPEVKVYDSIADILRDVNVGRVEAGFGDHPIVAYQLGTGSYPEVRLVSSYEPRMVGEIGIGVRKGDGELLARVNDSIARLEANGTLDRIFGEWKLR